MEVVNCRSWGCPSWGLLLRRDWGVGFCLGALTHLHPSVPIGLLCDAGGCPALSGPTAPQLSALLLGLSLPDILPRC